jgi:acetyl-CoA/propionyl-CoA carboxylase biotin carboxyl carrier protein
VNAGTVEFIADLENPAEHYFLEMNARLQVEHPVTEAVCGLDLVELQLRVAAGEPLPLTQSEVVLRGHAIEARITAEDPERGFLPAAGRVLAYAPPPGVRVDDVIETGSVVDTAYDSLLAKVIVHAEDRAQALARLERALAQTTILGVSTTIGYLRGLLADDAVRAGRMDTGLVDRRGVPPSPIDDAGIATAAAMLLRADRAASAGDDPFARRDGWRLGGVRAPSRWRLAVGAGDPVEVELSAELAATARPLGDGRFAIDGRGEWRLAPGGGPGPAIGGEPVWVGHAGWAWPVRRVSARQADGGGGDGELRAPMPGQVLLLPVAVGDAVRAGDAVVVLESMKMELTLAAPGDGTVTELSVAVGDRVVVDQSLARVESDG